MEANAQRSSPKAVKDGSRGSAKSRPGLHVALLVVAALSAACGAWLVFSHGNPLAGLLCVPIILAAGCFGYRGLAVGTLLSCALLYAAVRESAGGSNSLLALAALVWVSLIGVHVVHTRIAQRHLLAEVVLRREREAELGAANRRLAGLNAVAAAASRSLDLSRILTDSLDRTLSLLGVNSGAIHLVDEASGRLDLVAIRGASSAGPAPSDYECVCRRVLAAGAPVLLAASGAGLTGAQTLAPRHCLASVPLRISGKVAGTVSVASGPDRPLTPADADLLAAVAGPVGMAVANAGLFREVQRLAEERQALLAQKQALETDRLRAAQLEGTMRAMRTVQDRVNNPLMVITANIELLEMQAAEESPRVRRALSQIIRAAREIAAVNERLGRITVPVTASTSVGETIDLERSEQASANAGPNP